MTDLSLKRLSLGREKCQYGKTVRTFDSLLVYQIDRVLAALLTFKKTTDGVPVLLTTQDFKIPPRMNSHPWSTPALGRVNFARRIDFDPVVAIARPFS